MSETSQGNWLLGEHQRRNGTTLQLATLFAPHRKRVTQLFAESAAAFQKDVQAGNCLPRGAVLGAGNCNDVDLNELLAKFQSLKLIDVDAEATARAVDNLVDPSCRERVSVASADLTGAFDYLQATCGKSNDAQPREPFDANKLKKYLEVTPHLDGAPFDCVLSSCLMSQLVDSIVLAIGAQHPSLVELILAVRRQHLRTLVQALVPSGRGVLVFDFVSSQTLPQLTQLAEGELNQALLAAIAAKNFFTGLNPFAVQSELTNHAEFVGKVSEVRLLPPWRWDIGVKQFAVSAIVFNRV